MDFLKRHSKTILTVLAIAAVPLALPFLFIGGIAKWIALAVGGSAIVFLIISQKNADGMGK